MSKHLVLSVKSYSFTNKDGQRITGAKVAYVNKKASVRQNELGHPPMIVNVSDDVEVLFSDVPGIYDMTFEQVTGKDNKPEIVLTDVCIVKPIDFDEIFA